MSAVTMRDMVDAGVHFGHRTCFRNPKMKPFIYNAYRKIHIIDLDQTMEALEQALQAVERMAAQNRQILFVGTKRAAEQAVREQALRCGMPYVNKRWLGGMLTNYRTVRQSMMRLNDLKLQKEAGDFDQLPKKEALGFDRQIEKLSNSVGGVCDMAGLPDALFVIDVDYERITVNEANRMKIPVIAVVDTNSDPSGVQHVIPGNDDAIRSIQLFASCVADAVIAGQQAASERGAFEFEDGDVNGSAVKHTQTISAPAEPAPEVAAEPEPAPEVAAEPEPAPEVAAEPEVAAPSKEPTPNAQDEDRSSS